MRHAFPPEAGPSREQAIVRAVQEGNFVPFVWREVSVSAPGTGLTAHYSIPEDVLKLGELGDSVRVNVSHQTAQFLADQWGTLLQTPRVADAATSQADTFIDANRVTSGALWDYKGAPTSTEYMVAHSVAIDQRSPGGGSIGGPWKLWMNSTRLENPEELTLGKRAALQYGFWSRSKLSPSTGGQHPLLFVWQTPGATHSITYTDYSEKLQPMARWARVTGPGMAPGGTMMDVSEMAQDPNLWPLVNHDGPILMHHPWLPVCPAGEPCADPPGGGGPMPPPPPKPPRPKPGKAYDPARLAPLAAVGIVLAAAAWSAP